MGAKPHGGIYKKSEQRVRKRRARKEEKQSIGKWRAGPELGGGLTDIRADPWWPSEITPQGSHSFSKQKSGSSPPGHARLRLTTQHPETHPSFT